MFIGTPGRHLRLSSSPNGTPWHYRATLTPIIVAQRYWPDIFTHFTNPSLTQKPRLFSTSLQARTLRATLKPIIVAKIQSTDASNRIEGIYTTDERLKAIVQEKVKPRNRNEEEISGYRDVLATIHESYEYIAPRPNNILQLHRDLYSFSSSAVGGT